MQSKKLVTEFIGTFTLIFIGAGAGAIGAGGLTGVALAHGLVIAAFAYAYGPISGAHLNPAVTFAMALSGRQKWGEATGYWIAQLLGGASGAGALFFTLGGASSGLGATVLADGVSVTQGIVIEALLTFFLVNTILQTAGRGRGGEFAGLAIGLTLVFAILMGGPLTGASLNPARTLGPAIYTGTLNLFWVYLVGTFLGAAGAVGIDRYLGE
jgi:aquaporin Z